MFDYCTSEKTEQLYLLTSITEYYYHRFGFKEIDRVEVPEEISRTKEFQDICPLSAIAMYKNQRLNNVLQ